MTACSAESNSLFRLYGFPIQHSVSPLFHNLVFDLEGQGKHYNLFSTTRVTPEMLQEIRSDHFGGSSVTMPLKGAIIQHLDIIEPESKATGAVNTIVKVRSPEGEVQLVGTNTDILGVKNALLRSLRLQHPSRNISPQDRYPPGVGAAVVYGGGATTRSSIYALTSIGLHPVYLVNRDEEEVKQVQAVFPDLVAKGSLRHLKNVDDVEELLVQSNSPPVLMVVGAIPAIKPVTKHERTVYTVASHIFTSPYVPPSTYNATLQAGSLPLPTTRLFLEMAYKPRTTPMLKVAAAHGWDAISGIEAFIEQAYAQARMWSVGNASAVIGSDPAILGPHIEQTTRNMILNMEDIVIREVEIDRAAAAQSKL